MNAIIAALHSSKIGGNPVSKIKIAIAGAGNCAASLVQGIEYYRSIVNGKKKKNEYLGLMNYDLGGYFPEDIEIVAAFDIDKRKVGETLDTALTAKPNCILPLQGDIPKSKVRDGPGAGRVFRAHERIPGGPYFYHRQ